MQILRPARAVWFRTSFCKLCTARWRIFQDLWFSCKDLWGLKEFWSYLDLFRLWNDIASTLTWINILFFFLSLIAIKYLCYRTYFFVLSFCSIATFCELLVACVNRWNLNVFSPTSTDARTCWTATVIVRTSSTRNTCPPEQWSSFFFRRHDLRLKPGITGISNSSLL